MAKSLIFSLMKNTHTTFLPLFSFPLLWILKGSLIKAFLYLFKKKKKKITQKPLNAALATLNFKVTI